ncbi:cytochrome c-type biogenesis protein CcmE [Ralstonia sp. GP73]|jgi:cytochrome c-type biogenesis protein CcmE|uniref:Cytochrome c-type biogenesis protein CcmE n=2 Tax=Ralstonia TaxID=48736 RepID=CCME_RALPJ|nr:MULTISPECIES: cytochrome c maturation protein CcmE [Ralstonia]B2UBM4.1 RecName: Full=Cytochrome c-type biogenesis protein CcmE; AltName: Full=Cytochrome c maturation protein E; AltName: Full=Heme chaperone CcmE [Ralstonia pickettii 12J]MBT2179808.1 cytochrome c maturation protein CcmE [Ralstonia pickettii]MDH6643881.1 cytochrome c-type biogenesis protein CcmE [Ralstonia sp. GP73]OCS50367.1 cytochrome c biogenesis protein CcmE [Ralstonia pickettii]CAJ0713274.1 Cytochrome c-type biogenesis pr
MTRRQRRLGILLAALVCAGAATALTLNAFRSNLVFFFSPTQIAAKEAPVAQVFRLGGLVERGSIQRERDGMTIRFIVTDTARGVPVVYHGLLPDLFREGKGVVARGRLGEDGVFVANEVLAKHDENYMPPEAADALRRAVQVNEQMAKESARSASR